MSHLIACPGCARHLRVSESACPFCSAPLDADLRARPAPRPPAMRLSRAALFALGTGAAALASGTVACSSSSTPQADVDAGHGESSSTFTAVAAYGGMAHSTPSHSESSTNYAVPYGVPASSGSETSHTDDADAGESSSAHVSGGALYGGMGMMTPHDGG